MMNLPSRENPSLSLRASSSAGTVAAIKVLKVHPDSAARSSFIFRSVMNQPGRVDIRTGVMIHQEFSGCPIEVRVKFDTAPLFRDLIQPFRFG